MKLIAAVAQTATVLFDTAATVAKAETLMAEAAARGARVLVFPEAFIGGYPKGADFHIFIGARTPEGRQDFKKYYDAAVTLDGPEIAQLAQAAGQYQLYVDGLRAGVHSAAGRLGCYCFSSCLRLLGMACSLFWL